MSFEIERAYWNQRYKDGGLSGEGSYGDQVKWKIEQLKGLDFKTVLDIGCGDGNFYQELIKVFPDIDYLGLDISEDIINKNKCLGGKWKAIRDLNFRQSADLVLCIDVLFHIIIEKELKYFVDKLKKIKCKYLVICTTKNSHTNFSKHLSNISFNASDLGEHTTIEVPFEHNTKHLYIYDRTKVQYW